MYPHLEEAELEICHSDIMRAHPSDEPEAETYTMGVSNVVLFGW